MNAYFPDFQPRQVESTDQVLSCTTTGHETTDNDHLSHLYTYTIYLIHPSRVYMEMCFLSIILAILKCIINRRINDCIFNQFYICIRILSGAFITFHISTKLEWQKILIISSFILTLCFSITFFKTWILIKSMQSNNLRWFIFHCCTGHTANSHLQFCDLLFSVSSLNEIHETIFST